MRLHDTNNAASATILLVMFALLGTACGILVIAAGFEPYVVQCGVVIYLCIGGPLLVAAQLGTPTPHKSFRLAAPQHNNQQSPPRRVLLFFSYVQVALIFVAASTAATIWAVNHFETLTTSAPLIVITFSVIAVIPYLSFRLTKLSFATIAVKLGWMTREENCQFLANRYGFPESWKQSGKDRDCVSQE